MATLPPPRPPPPSPHREKKTSAEDTNNPEPQSKTRSGDFGSNMESDNDRSPHERRRSNTYSAPPLPSKPPPEHSNQTPLSPARPPLPLRLKSSSPPPAALPTPTQREGAGEGGIGRGRSSNGRSRPTRPPPPTRAKSLPRGGHLKMWEHTNNANIGRPHSKSSDNVNTTPLQEGIIAPAPGVISLNSILDGDSRKPPLADGKEGESGDATPGSGKSEEPLGEGLEPGAAVPGDTPSSPPPVTESTPSPSSSAPPPVQPMIPPRPYRPPRPFPPPAAASSSSSSPSRSPGSKHRNQTHKTHHGDPRHKTESQPEGVDTRSNSLGSAQKPDVIDQQSHDKSPDKSPDIKPTDVESHVEAPHEDDASHDHQTSPSVTANEEEKGEIEKIAELPTHDIIDAKVSQKKSPQSGSKGRRLFKSVRSGLKTFRHKKTRSGIAHTAIRKTQSDFMGPAADDAIEEEENLYPDPLPQGIVDPLVVLCVAYLNRETILREAGLFRIPGDHATVKKLRSDYIRGEPVNLNSVLDPHTVAGLLKYHFREWRVSIVPRGKPLEEITSAVRAKDEGRVRDVLQSLSQDNHATLRMVAELLSKVVEFSEWNKMTSGTLATSCGPSFFPYLPPSPANTLLKFMIDHCTTLFPE